MDLPQRSLASRRREATARFLVGNYPEVECTGLPVSS